VKIWKNRTFITIFKLGLSAGGLFFVFTKIGFRDIVRIFGHSDLLLVIAALFFFVLSKYVSAIRLNIFFRSAGLNLAKIYNLKLYLLGMYYNLFLPGGIGGDGYKIWILNKNHKISSKKIFSAVLLDRLTGMMALICLAVILSLFIKVDILFSFKMYIWILIPLSISGFYLLIKIFFPDFSGNYIRTSIQAFVVQMLQVACVFGIFRALGGSEKAVGYLFLFLCSSVVASFPVTIGGVGLREICFLYGSRFLGLDTNLSIALSLVFYLLTLFVSFWGIIYSFRETGRSQETGVRSQI
jgi:glycosyltransferase 2 family protein